MDPTLRHAFRRGFIASVVYAGAGLVLELSFDHLPHDLYIRGAALLLGPPARLLEGFGLRLRLAEALAAGNLTPWLATAALPAAGVLLLFASSLGIGLLGLAVRRMLRA